MAGSRVQSPDGVVLAVSPPSPPLQDGGRARLWHVRHAHLVRGTSTPNQCCGSVSGIRCLFDPWILDPVSVMGKKSGYNEVYFQGFFLKKFACSCGSTTFDADPSLTYRFDAELDPVPAPHESDANLRPDLQTRRGFFLSLHASIVSVHDPPWIHFEPPQLLIRVLFHLLFVYMRMGHILPLNSMIILRLLSSLCNACKSTDT
jgi:hypothetical protein